MVRIPFCSKAKYRSKSRSACGAAGVERAEMADMLVYLALGSTTTIVIGLLVVNIRYRRKLGNTN